MSRTSQFGAFADRDPENAPLLCDLLDALLTFGDLDAAGTRLDGISPAMRALPGVRFREARYALQRGETARAVELLQQLLASTDTAPVGVVHDLAFAQLTLGQVHEALQTLASAQPDNADEVVAIALLKARVLHRLQQCEAALDALASIEAGPRLAEVQGMRALLWLDLGDTQRASAAAALALQLDPDQHEAGIAGGTAALWAQRVDESTLAFERVLARHPDSGRAWLGLGQTRMLRGDIPAARVLLERASREMPDHIGTWHALAWCQLLEGDLAGAHKSFQLAFALDRTFGETHGGFALVHALRGERAEAEASIKRATRLDPIGRAARYAQSVLLVDDGQVEQARQIIDGILVQTPGLHKLPADFIFRLRDLVRPKG